MHALGGCSVLVDQSATQCAAQSDCERFPQTTCVLGACVLTPGFDAAIDPQTPCSSTQDCLTLHGSNWVCQNRACLALGSDECGIVLGNYTADDVLLLGAILPLYNAHKSTGLPMERSLAFAVEQDFTGGVLSRGGSGTRSVAIVLCDESQNPVAAARHLAEDVHIPAILGPASGDSFLAVAQQVAVPDGVLLVSPYATADLSRLALDAGTPGAGGEGLVWRTAPTSAGEAAAMSGVVSGVLEPRIRAAQSLGRVKASLVWRGDADGTSLHEALRSSLVLNSFPATSLFNQAYFAEVSYGNSDSPGDLATAAVKSVTTAPLPQLVLVIGRTEAVTDIIEGIENVWPRSAAAPPYYLVSHGLQVQELLDLASARPTLRARVLSTAPGASAASNGAMRELLVRYQALYTDYPAQTFGLAQTFDAFYALAYGLAAVRNGDVRGLDERDGLQKVFFGSGAAQQVTVGPEDIGKAFSAIVAGEPIALGGTSGPLAFDPNTGTPPSDVQVWCMTSGAADAVFTSASIAFDAASGTLNGTLAPGCLE